MQALQSSNVQCNLHDFCGYQNLQLHEQKRESEKTREQVIAETKAAMQQGLLSYGESNYPMPVPNVGPGKTRQEVINEMLNESPAERDARQRLYYPG